MNSDILCKLTISKRFPGKKVLLGLIVISFLAAVLALIPLKKSVTYVYNEEREKVNFDDVYERYILNNIFGDGIVFVDDGYNGKLIENGYYDSDWTPLERHHGGVYHYAGEHVYSAPRWNYYLRFNVSFLFMSILIAGFVFILFIALYLRSCIQKCDVSLFGERIAGVQKRLFSRHSIDFPIEKLDSLYVKDSLFDKFWGGKTAVIKTSSSVIKFFGMENADEFVNLAIKQIKEYQQSVLTNTMSHGNNASSNDEFEKIQKLKQLLDQGIISQEEFEAKRNELMEKI